MRCRPDNAAGQIRAHIGKFGDGDQIQNVELPRQLPVPSAASDKQFSYEIKSHRT
jgi:hypothetical protein